MGNVDVFSFSVSFSFPILQDVFLRDGSADLLTAGRRGERRWKAAFRRLLRFRQAFMALLMNS